MTTRCCILFLSGFLALARGDTLTLTDGTEITCDSVKLDKEEVVYVSGGKETRVPRVKVIRMTDEKTEEEKQAGLAQLLKDFKGHKDVKDDNWGKLFKISESNCLRAETEPAYQYVAPVGWYQNFTKKLDDTLAIFSYVEPGPKVTGHITVLHCTKAETREGTEEEDFKENLEANEGTLKNFKAGKKETLTIGKWKVIRQAISGIDRETGDKRRGYEVMVSITPKAGLALTLLAPDDKDFARREQLFMGMIESLKPLDPAG